MSIGRTKEKGKISKTTRGKERGMSRKQAIIKKI